MATIKHFQEVAKRLDTKCKNNYYDIAKYY